jgi:hypothetical protein
LTPIPTSGFSRFNQFCLQAQVCDQEDMESPFHADSSEVVEHTAEDNQDEAFELPAAHPHGLDGVRLPTLNELPNSEHDLDTGRESASAEFLRYHHKYNHISPHRIQAMARDSTIPKWLANCPVPVCMACLYGNPTRRPWRSRHPVDRKQAPPATRPGQVVSVDQMKSPTPGLVAQMTGSLTKAWYETATIFVDHATDLSYVHLQKSASAVDTVEAKKAFEQFAQQHGVAVSHYHCDNGVFTAHLWRNNCTEKLQGLSFLGVTPTTKMAEQRSASGTCNKRRAPCSSTLIAGGQPQSRPTCGRTLCALQTSRSTPRRGSKTTCTDRPSCCLAVSTSTQTQCTGITSGALCTCSLGLCRRQGACSTSGDREPKSVYTLDSHRNMLDPWRSYSV